MKLLVYELEKIYYQLDKILLLFATLFFVIEVIWVPINSFLSEGLLSLTGHAYLSPTNLWAVLTEKWWVTLLFIFLLILNLLLAYLQIGFLFVGVHALLENRVKHMKDFIHEVYDGMLEILRTIRLSKVVFVLAYSVILLPFLRKILHIYFFDKIILPQFVIDYLAQNSLVALVFFLSVFLFFWLASRFMFALPQIYFEEQSVASALRYSWIKTRGKLQYKTTSRLLIILLVSLGFFWMVAALVYLIQMWADELPSPFDFLFAIVHFIIIQLAYYGTIAVFMTKFIALLTDQRLPFYKRERLRHRLRLAIVAAASLYFAVQGVTYLYFPFQTLPVTISHRGVDMANGVQNTLDSLEKTAKIKPDYIEMDVQETKDGQFVVMHDTDLRPLTGNPGGTHDYTLDQLTAMTASENGMSSPVPSFDDYLAKAEQLQQKLLVEVKVTNQDSPYLIAHFLEKYGQRLVAGNHQLQSLDYDVIKEAKQFNKKLVSAFILPFNSIYPTTVANAYTMEYSSLDQGFMTQSWIRQKKVYAWTPNDADSMTEMIQLQVDGIITDDLTGLKAVITELSQDHDYVDLLFFEINHLLYQF